MRDCGDKVNQCGVSRYPGIGYERSTANGLVTKIRGTKCCHLMVEMFTEVVAKKIIQEKVSAKE